MASNTSNRSVTIGGSNIGSTIVTGDANTVTTTNQAGSCGGEKNSTA